MRLFVSLEIPETVRAALIELGERLAKLCRGARWVRLEGAHITLKFIGEVSAEKAEQIGLALGRIHAPAPIDLRFAGLGFFPSAKRPRIFWAGIAPNPALAALAATVEERLAPLGIAREPREFSPHITLAKLSFEDGIAALRAAVDQLGQPEFGRVTAREFHLYQSVLRRTGAEYTRMATYDFSRESAT